MNKHLSNDDVARKAAFVSLKLHFFVFRSVNVQAYPNISERRNHLRWIMTMNKRKEIETLTWFDEKFC